MAIQMFTKSIEPLRRLQQTIERFQVELGSDSVDREVIAKISLLEPGEENIVLILSKEEWSIFQGAFKALEGK